MLVTSKKADLPLTQTEKRVMALFRHFQKVKERQKAGDYLYSADRKANVVYLRNLYRWKGTVDYYADRMQSAVVGLGQFRMSLKAEGMDLVGRPLHYRTFPSYRKTGAMPCSARPTPIPKNALDKNRGYSDEEALETKNALVEDLLMVRKLYNNKVRVECHDPETARLNTEAATSPKMMREASLHLDNTHTWSTSGNKCYSKYPQSMPIGDPLFMEERVGKYLDKQMLMIERMTVNDALTAPTNFLLGCYATLRHISRGYKAMIDAIGFGIIREMYKAHPDLVPNGYVRNVPTAGVKRYGTGLTFYSGRQTGSLRQIKTLNMEVLVPLVNAGKVTISIPRPIVECHTIFPDEPMSGVSGKGTAPFWREGQLFARRNLDGAIFPRRN